MRAVFLFSCVVFLGCRVPLVSGIEEREANYFLYYLLSSGIQAEKKEKNGKYVITVSKQDLVPALQISNQLHRFTQTSTVDSKKKSGRFSKEEEQFYLERLLSRQIEETLENLQYVSKARVHIFSPNYESLSLKQLERENSSAAILITSEEPEKVELEIVRSIVSGATGLPQEKIRVEVSMAPKLTSAEVGKGDDLNHESSIAKGSKLKLLLIFLCSLFGLGGAVYVFRRSSRV